MTTNGDELALTSPMTKEDAIRAAEEWVRVRLEVRSHLIAAARANHPPQEPGPDQDVTIRKLYDYPSDLSEKRLLALARGTR